MTTEILKAVILFLFPMSPSEASKVVPKALGFPKAAEVLKKTCRRESRCRPIGPHKGDLWAGDTMWARAVKVGLLRPESCSFHSKDAVDTWAPSGAWGASRAYTLHYLKPFDCIPADWLDLPIVGAIANTLRVKTLCLEKGACSPSEVREYWRGKGNVARAKEREIEMLVSAAILQGNATE